MKEPNVKTAQGPPRILYKLVKKGSDGGPWVGRKATRPPGLTTNITLLCQVKNPFRSGLSVHCVHMSIVTPQHASLIRSIDGMLTRPTGNEQKFGFDKQNRIMSLKKTAKWLWFTFELKGNVNYSVKITGGNLNTKTVFVNHFLWSNSQHLPLACHTGCFF